MNIYVYLKVHSVTLRKLLILFFPFLSFSGLTYKKLNRLDEALDCFLKLHAILRNSAQVLHQIASMYLSGRGARITHAAPRTVARRVQPAR